MSEVVTATRIPFGTVAAVFATAAAAEAAAAALTARSYPRALVQVLTGQPWTADGPAAATGFEPDPELRFRLTPTAPAEAAPVEGNPALAPFVGDLWAARARRRNPAFWPLVTLVVGIVVTLLSLYSRDWMVVTLVSLVALMVVAAAFTLAYARARVVTFPFRDSIASVDEALEAGGALVTVACTLPYQRPVRELLAEHGGEVIGYAPEVVYPVPA